MNFAAISITLFISDLIPLPIEKFIGQIFIWEPSMQKFVLDKNRNTYAYIADKKYPWMQFEMVMEEEVHLVQITNLQNNVTVEVRVGNENVSNTFNQQIISVNEFCGDLNEQDLNTHIIKCTKPQKGKFVTIQITKDKKESLKMSEVDIFGKRKGKKTQLESARNKQSIKFIISIITI